MFRQVLAPRATARSPNRADSHRRLFATPFWSEGQSLYWEMFLWDHGCQATPEDRVGALFWRMSNGNSRKGMPSFSSFPEAQRWQLVLYIRSLKKATPQ